MSIGKEKINDKDISFQSISNDDIFYAKSNVDALEKAAKQIPKGEVANKTFEELEDIANEFDVIKHENNDDGAFGLLNKYANINNKDEEKDAFKNAMMEKYTNID